MRTSKGTNDDRRKNFRLSRRDARRDSGPLRVFSKCEFNITETRHPKRDTIVRMAVAICSRIRIMPGRIGRNIPYPS